MSAVIIHLMDEQQLRPLRSRNHQKAPDADLWSRIVLDARSIMHSDECLASLITSNILIWPTLTLALSHRLATRLADRSISASLLGKLFGDAYRESRAIAKSAQDDLLMLAKASPAQPRPANILLFCKAYHAIQAHRLAHWLWANGHRDLSLLLHSRSAATFQSNLHPSRDVEATAFLDLAGLE